MIRKKNFWEFCEINDEIFMNWVMNWKNQQISHQQSNRISCCQFMNDFNSSISSSSSHLDIFLDLMMENYFSSLSRIFAFDIFMKMNWTWHWIRLLLLRLLMEFSFRRGKTSWWVCLMRLTWLPRELVEILRWYFND